MKSEVSQQRFGGAGRGLMSSAHTYGGGGGGGGGHVPAYDGRIGNRPIAADGAAGYVGCDVHFSSSLGGSLWREALHWAREAGRF
jgi:hypothetical protein